MKKDILKLISTTTMVVLMGTSSACALSSKPKEETMPELIPESAFPVEPVKSEFEAWLDALYLEAIESGISQATVEDALSRLAEPNEKVIKLDRTQYEFTHTFESYYKKVINNKRIKDAKKYYRENRKELDNVAKQFGVQPRFIVALWAIESNFGQRMGNFSVIEALATLAYDGRRADFFRGELLKALKIVDEGHITLDDMKGSWAGAMGQSQFMPSSFEAYAVDQNKDGKRDIWGTKSDVFGSIANYLSESGWDDEYIWGRKVKLPKNFDRSKVGIKDNKNMSESRTIADWQEFGIRKANGWDLPRVEIKGSLVIFQDEEGMIQDSYLVYDNYRTLLKWNRSLYFATAVGLLSDKLRFLN